MLRQPHTLYLRVPDSTRQHLNGAFFERFYIDDEPIRVTRVVRRAPVDEILEAVVAYQEDQRLAKLGEGWKRDVPPSSRERT